MAPNAKVWEFGDGLEMEKVQSDLSLLTETVRKQGEDTAVTLKSVSESIQTFVSNQAVLCENIKSISSWVPTVEGPIHALQLSLAEVNSRVAILESGYTSDDDQTPRPEGHHVLHDTQGTVTIASKARAPALAKGTRKFNPTPVNFDLTDRSEGGGDSYVHESRSYNRSSRPPKTDFPRFDGDNPKWWKKVAEKYFMLYDVDHDTWANFATMHFVGNAALWLQTFEAEHDVDNWEELCVAVHSKFGRDKHHRHLEALERCRQTETVEKYYNKFEAIRHKILVYNKHYDEAFFYQIHYWLEKRNSKSY